MKLCLACMRRVPLLAGRCPYCRDEDQGVHGRIVLLILFIIGIVISAHYKDDIVVFIDRPVDNVVEPIDREILNFERNVQHLIEEKGEIE